MDVSARIAELRTSSVWAPLARTGITWGPFARGTGMLGRHGPAPVPLPRSAAGQLCEEILGRINLVTAVINSFTLHRGVNLSVYGKMAANGDNSWESVGQLQMQRYNLKND